MSCSGRVGRVSVLTSSCVCSWCYDYVLCMCYFCGISVVFRVLCFRYAQLSVSVLCACLCVLCSLFYFGLSVVYACYVVGECVLLLCLLWCLCVVVSCSCFTSFCVVVLSMRVVVPVVRVSIGVCMVSLCLCSVYVVGCCFRSCPVGACLVYVMRGVWCVCDFWVCCCCVCVIMCSFPCHVSLVCHYFPWFLVF